MNPGAPHKPLRVPLLALAATVMCALLMAAAATATIPQARIAVLRHHRAALARIAAECPGSNATAASAPAATLSATVVCLINGERRRFGLPTLTERPTLELMAHSWSAFMVAHDEYDHANFILRLKTAGYAWRTAAENIASGYATPRWVVAAWMASTEHCRNILDPEFRDMGIGVVAAPIPSAANMGATWTLDLGLAANASPASSNTGPASGCPYSG